jgi:hypothetical protein
MSLARLISAVNDHFEQSFYSQGEYVSMMQTLRRTAMVLAAAATCLAAGCSDDPATPSTGNGDVTLAAPPAGQGYQVVIGPFDVPSGEEVQKNYYQKMPNDEDIYVTKIEFRFNSGSHHLNIFKSDSILVDDHVENTFNALQWESWDMVAASQKGEYTWTLPPGVAIKMKAHQQMDFQTHYVNAGTQATPTGRGKAIVNFWTTDKKNVTSLVGAEFSNNKTIMIPAYTAATFCKTVKPLDHEVKILLMTGHFHSRGKTFTVGHWDGTKLTDTIYTSAAWSDPPILQFTTPLTLPKGDSLAFITTYENRSGTDIKFGPHVEYEEHANLFTFFYPSENGKATYDFNGGFMVESHSLK